MVPSGWVAVTNSQIICQIFIFIFFLPRLSQHLDLHQGLSGGGGGGHTFLVASGSSSGDTLKWCTLPSEHLRVKRQLSLARIYGVRTGAKSLVQNVTKIPKCDAFRPDTESRIFF